METKAHYLTFVLIAAVIILTALSAVIDFPDDSRLWIEIQNAGHMPFYGLLTLVLLGLSVKLLGERQPNRYVHYLVALGIATALGGINELLQIEGPRDADLMDLVRNVAGSLVFLALFMLVDSGLKGLRASWKRYVRYVIVIGSLMITLAVLVPVALLASAYQLRNEAFPMVCDFESRWERKFIDVDEARLQIVDAPDLWVEAKGGYVGRVDFRVARYPGFSILEPYPDWSGYGVLVFEVLSELDTAVSLNIRIEDERHSGEYDDRYTGTFKVLPGASQIRIPLSEVRKAPLLREHDMTAIRAIQVYAVSPLERFSLYFDNVHVE